MPEQPQILGKPLPELQSEPQTESQPGLQLETQTQPPSGLRSTWSPPQNSVPAPQTDPQFDRLVDPQLALTQTNTRPTSREALAEPSASRTQEDPGEALTEFPKKRRGRPPGRPNSTVREADYQSNPNVQLWNSAKIDRPIPAVAINIREALTEDALVHDTQREIFKMPSREFIHFVNGWITARHIASQRPSYVNGLLIHSRGGDSRVSCTQCVERRAKNALGPFLTCRVLPGSFHDSCSNCKWFDNTSACSLYTGPKPNRKRKAKEITAADASEPNQTRRSSDATGNAGVGADANAQQSGSDSQRENPEGQGAGINPEQANGE